MRGSMLTLRWLPLAGGAEHAGDHVAERVEDRAAVRVAIHEAEDVVAAAGIDDHDEMHAKRTLKIGGR